MKKGNAYKRLRRAIIREGLILLAALGMLALFTLLFAAAGIMHQ